MRETQVQILGWEDPLEKGTVTCFSILAWEFPWTEQPGRLQSMELQRVRHDWVTNTNTYMHFSYPQINNINENSDWSWIYLVLEERVVLLNMCRKKGALWVTYALLQGQVPSQQDASMIAFLTRWGSPPCPLTIPRSCFLTKKVKFQDFHDSPSFTAVGCLLITHHSVHLSGIFKQIFLDGSSHWSFCFTYYCHPNYIYIWRAGSIGEAQQIILKYSIHLELNKITVWSSMPPTK